MKELTNQSDFRQRAAATKRARTFNALLDAADTVFADSDYRGVRTEHVAHHAAVGAATFYYTFPRKSTWGAAVLNRRLNGLLEVQSTDQPPAPDARLLGYLSLLGEAAMPMPGITRALLDERAEEESYSALLPRYHGVITEAITEGQQAGALREDVDPIDGAGFALDAMAAAYALRLDSASARLVPSLAIGSLLAR